MTHSHASVAASVRAKKELHPEHYCGTAKCLWQIVTPRGPNPCRNHPLPTLVPGERITADFDDVSNRTEIIRAVTAVTACDICPLPAINMVNVTEHRFHSFRCAEHTRSATAQFAVIGVVTHVEPLRRSVQ